VRHQRELPKAYEDVHDDPHQMGGNFIFEMENLKMVYAYRSKTPPDRPNAETLLSELLKLQK